VSHRFALRERHERHFWWDVNDHLAALMEHLPDGPWADVPHPLGPAICAWIDALFGPRRFTLVQVLREPLPHELTPPPRPWDPERDAYYTGQQPPKHDIVMELYERRAAKYGPPVARDSRHAGRIIAEALRIGGWRVWVEDGLVKFQQRQKRDTAQPPDPTGQILTPV